MTATIEHPQAPETPSRVRHGASYWVVTMVAVLGLAVGAAIGYWWGDSAGGTSDDVTPDGTELTEDQEAALTVVDQVTVALNTGDIDDVTSQYVSDFGWTQPDPQAYADEYFGTLESLQTAGAEFVSTDAVVLGEPFDAMVDVCQFLTASNDDAPSQTLVMWYRVIPESMTIVEAGFGCNM